MSEPFLAEVRMVGFDFAPRGWAFCDGQILPINQNQSLYSLLGTTYGGDGRTSFALPDLRGRVPMHEGEGHGLGAAGGAETHTLSVGETPQHSHFVNASTEVGTTDTPTGQYPARAADDVYGPLSTPAAMGSQMVGATGGSQGHENMQPYLVVNFCIALQGLFPSRN